jgi:hypothetical protein
MFPQLVPDYLVERKRIRCRTHQTIYPTCDIDYAGINATYEEARLIRFQGSELPWAYRRFRSLSGGDFDNLGELKMTPAEFAPTYYAAAAWLPLGAGGARLRRCEGTRDKARIVQTLLKRRGDGAPRPAWWGGSSLS